MGGIISVNTKIRLFIYDIDSSSIPRVCYENTKHMFKNVYFYLYRRPMYWILIFVFVSEDGRRSVWNTEECAMIDNLTENMYGIKLLVSKDFKQNNVWGSFNKTEAVEASAVNVSRVNQTIYSLSDDEYIFDRTDVRAIFITLYTIVFCCCFFGKCIFT